MDYKRKNSDWSHPTWDFHFACLVFLQQNHKYIILTTKTNILFQIVKFHIFDELFDIKNNVNPTLCRVLCCSAPWSDFVDAFSSFN